MCYPEPRYFDDNGKVSATLRRIDEVPKVATGTSTEMRYLASGDLTDGRFGLYQVEMQAGARGAKMHFHRTMSETSTFWLGDFP